MMQNGPNNVLQSKIIEYYLLKIKTHNSGKLGIKLDCLHPGDLKNIFD